MRGVSVIRRIIIAAILSLGAHSALAATTWNKVGDNTAWAKTDQTCDWDATNALEWCGDRASTAMAKITTAGVATLVTGPSCASPGKIASVNFSPTQGKVYVACGVTTNSTTGYGEIFSCSAPACSSWSSVDSSSSGVGMGEMIDMVDWGGHTLIHHQRSPGAFGEQIRYHDAPSTNGQFQQITDFWGTTGVPWLGTGVKLSSTKGLDFTCRDTGGNCYLFKIESGATTYTNFTSLGTITTVRRMVTDGTIGVTIIYSGSDSRVLGFNASATKSPDQTFTGADWRTGLFGDLDGSSKLWIFGASDGAAKSSTGSTFSDASAGNVTLDGSDSLAIAVMAGTTPMVLTAGGDVLTWGVAATSGARLLQVGPYSRGPYRSGPYAPPPPRRVAR